MVAARTGISLHEFDQLTPTQVHELVKEHHHVEENRYRSHAELHRMFTAFLLNVHLKKMNQITDPRRLVTFPWESEINENTMEELLNTDWDALDEKYNNLKPYQRPKKQNLY